MAYRHYPLLLHGRKPSLLPLLVLLMVALTTATTFILLLSSLTVVMRCPLPRGRSPRSTKLVVLLISSDSFHFGYQFKLPLLHIRRLITGNGVGVLLITYSYG
jgi:hypothetical protein